MSAEYLAKKSKKVENIKIFKRNAVIITVLLFVCAAVYLNWSYSREVEDAASAGSGLGADTSENTPQLETIEPETTGETLEDDLSGANDITSVSDTDDTDIGSDAGLFYTEDSGQTVETDSTVSEYFAKVRLERQQARDSASATLETVASTEGAAQETVDEALASMAQMAEWSVKEAELENMIRAKGFTDCVVYLSESGATVTVAADDMLSEASVAKITDVIVTETDFAASDLRVVEIK